MNTEIEAMRHGLQVAIDAAGSQAKLAHMLGFSRGAIHKWVRNGYVPANRCVAVEKATGIDRVYLRPDLYRREDAAA